MYAGLKRFFDIIASILLLVLLSPLFLLLVLLLWASGEPEVFYRQERIGFRQQPFQIWKFATMVKDSLSMGNGDVTVRNDPRVTRIGSFLRISKLNELPQLVNILKGEMSFVGPRPLMHSSFILYPPGLQERMGGVLPGLTGIGSIFFRDEEAILSASSLPARQCYEQVIMPYKGELEAWYLEHFSFKTDFTLLLLTIWYIFFPHSKLLFTVFPGLPRKDGFNH